MNVYQIIVNLIEKPDVPKFYRDLRNHYIENKLLQEAEVYEHLIETKFGKKDDSNNNTHPSQES